MKIVVCIKQVPDTTEVRIDPESNRLIREGVPSIINPDDKAGLETALQLKEILNATVTAVCMGPNQADIALREALAMGCDEAVLVSGSEFAGSDTYATATILAATLKKIEFDIIITGLEAIDGNTAQVGPQLAERLSIPQVSYASHLQVDNNQIFVTRHFEDGYHLIKIKLPCLIAVLEDIATPRYMTVQGIENAFTANIRYLTFDDLKDLLNPDFIGLKGSPTRVIKTFTKEPKGKGEIIMGLTSDEAVDAIIQKLSKHNII